MEFRPSRYLLTVIGLCTMLIIAGCLDFDNSSAKVDSNRTETINTTTPETDTQAATDLRNERLKSWSRYELLSDSQIKFYFNAGDPECYAVRTEVQETAHEIRVATIEGTKPDAPQSCLAVGRQAILVVHTEKPIGTRAIKHLDNPQLRQ